MPATGALILEAALIAYAIHSARRQDPLVQRYLALLTLFAAQNGVTLALARSSPDISTLSCLVFALPILALLTRIARGFMVPTGGRIATAMFYAPVAALEGLLLGTQALLTRAGGQAHAGPWYPLLEIFVGVAGCAILLGVTHAALRGSSAHSRLRARWWLIAVAPFVTLITATVLSLGFGHVPRWLLAAEPMALSFFLLVSAYATYEYRLLDIEFYLPWSTVRRRKTAFHERLRVMISELADLPSVDEAVRRLAEVLRCPVALVTVDPAPLAVAGGEMTDIPRPALRQIERTLVTRELHGKSAGLAVLLQHHHIAAVVPFHPYSRRAGGWLLLGESFGEEVVTPLDFRLVERLFDRLADLFIDRQLALRATLDEALGQIAALRAEVTRAQALALPSPRPRIAFAGEAAGFRALRAALPEVVVHQDGRGAGVLISGSARHDPDCAELECDVVLWGAALSRRARALASSPRLVDIADAAAPEDVSRRVHVLVGLRAALKDDLDPEEPLLGTSPVYRRALLAAQSLPTTAAIWLQGNDRGQAWSWARVISGLPVWPAGINAPAPCAWLVEDDRPIGAGRVFVFSTDAALARHWNAQPFALPSLAERDEDLTLLAQYFALRFRQRTGSPKALSEDACMDIRCATPATVAELRAEVYARLSAERGDGRLVECGSQNLREQVDAFEADLIRQTLTRCGGNRAQAARLLGLKPNTLHYKLKRYGLS